VCDRDINTLNEKEIYWINKLNSLNRSIGFNISSGGGNGYSLEGKSFEEKKKIYKKIVAKRIEKWSVTGNPRIGTNISEKQKEYLSFINKGDKHPMYGTKRPIHSEKMSGSNNPRAKKVICITTGEKFGNAKDAAERYNTTNSNILKCCRGIQATAGKSEDGIRLVWQYI
jgi:hypothetical protein